MAARQIVSECRKLLQSCTEVSIKVPWGQIKGIEVSLLHVLSQMCVIITLYWSKQWRGFLKISPHPQVGPRDAPPVLLFHGWLDNCHSFLPLLTKLPKNRRYIALDLPGHGHSSHKPNGSYNFILSELNLLFSY